MCACVFGDGVDVKGETVSGHVCGWGGVEWLNKRGLNIDRG